MLNPILLPVAPAGSLLSLIGAALERWSGERDRLAWLPDHRYEAAMFPTIGQYDWFSGIALYSIVRESRPARVIEFSTSSGYSTCFTALALQANGSGVVHTVDLDEAPISAAHARWEDLGVTDRVQFHKGDCHAVVPRLLDEGPADLLFIDSLHSKPMARWYLAQVAPRLRPDDLVHIHDVMPPEARVRIHGGPPWPHMRDPRPQQLSGYVRMKRRLFYALRGQRVPLPVESTWDRVDWEAVGRTIASDSFDGNYFDEALLLRPALASLPREEVVFLHSVERSIAKAHPELQAYAPGDRIGRSLPDGTPLEWNDAVWMRGRTFAQVADRVRENGR